MKRTALFSLNDTSCADQFAEELIHCGWEIIATAETVDLLSRKGLPVRDIAEYTGVNENYGFPPTLHAKVEFALTGSSEPSIDLVYVIPYPLSVGNDIGGRTLLGLAVKGGRIAVMCVEDMKRVVAQISCTKDISEPLRLELADKACAAIARHYTSLVKDKRKGRILSGRFAMDLKNGENPYQKPASAFVLEEDDDPLSLLKFRRVSGDSPCFTNMADADSILYTMCLTAEALRLNMSSLPHICIAAKHGNPCGMAVSEVSRAHAVEETLFGDPRSIWGGEVITNFTVDEELAGLLLASSRREELFGAGKWMLDLIMAPSFTTQAINVLGRRSERKLYENSALETPFITRNSNAYRFVRGGFLNQPPADYILDVKECRWAGCNSQDLDIASLIVAWAVAFSSNHGGNEIALAKDGILLGAGGGPSTVEAARVAVTRAKEHGNDIRGAVFAADAFFPFTDAPGILVDAGVTSGCVPGGGKNEEEIKNYFSSQGIAMLYLPDQYRGFCRH